MIRLRQTADSEISPILPALQHATGDQQTSVGKRACGLRSPSFVDGFDGRIHPHRVVDVFGMCRQQIEAYRIADPGRELKSLRGRLPRVVIEFEHAVGLRLHGIERRQQLRIGLRRLFQGLQPGRHLFECSCRVLVDQGLQFADVRIFAD